MASFCSPANKAVQQLSCLCLINPTVSWISPQHFPVAAEWQAWLSWAALELHSTKRRIKTFVRRTSETWNFALSYKEQIAAENIRMTTKVSLKKSGVEVGPTDSWSILISLAVKIRRRQNNIYCIQLYTLNVFPTHIKTSNFTTSCFIYISF